METYGNWGNLPDREHRAFVERVERRWEAMEERQSRGSAFFAAFLFGLLMVGIGFLPGGEGGGTAAFPLAEVLVGLWVAVVFFLLALVTAKNAPAAMLPVCMAFIVCGLGTALLFGIASTVGLMPFGCLVAAIWLLGTVCSLA